ncbi:unnamed protein product [Camellia sinensis]
MEKLNSMNLLLYMAPIAVLFLIPATLLMEENMVGITIALARDDIKIIFYLLFNSALAYCVNLTNFLVTKHTSALALQRLRKINIYIRTHHLWGTSVRKYLSYTQNTKNRWMVTKNCSNLASCWVEKEIEERREISFHRVGISMAPPVSFQDIVASHGDFEEILEREEV